ncbi:toll/interleukin-1 receptor domain-containing protein [Xanthomonas campestris]|uniref:toll/interleukin-1 receptor domain-containing protein n=2 Tax=Xanthomonas campestris TaxID=339 RepID=UPI00035D688E|nr:toll/interleukin-1 receptor domain-containing protein [Xanthomonas campestris]MEA0763272.1 toll/interleukin-1 receptor domain-containing protein [Xanthomonas campestris pv. campestris]MEA9597944.1 toll/interleukin-1 receptor domain-containing protein [Xanthomonas campestris]MEA9728354.1 toll/interleukin-1 receptor domain-containing protein [Xanthomonas campestris pv. raphani]MEB1225109.1 toll/interleukin-1 receptor domain-containing protein [Xanthomonas campestris pv. campestris]MEB1245778.
MAQKIFLSHNHHDKPLVEAVAVELANIFGQKQVFYDSWSIRPGDGIIDQMNKGLEAPEFVFFFVSASSLASGMVKLEWQNALYAATKGKTRLIPVRVDGSDIPAVLAQTFFIDMHTIGLDAAIAQIVSVSQGSASFVPQHKGFSNLTYSAVTLADDTLEVTIQASHLMEANPNFAFPVINGKDEISWWIKGHPAIQSAFHEQAFELTEGGMANAVVMRPITGSLTPAHPLTFEFRQLGASALNLIDVLHDQGQAGWVRVPGKSFTGQSDA